MLSRQRSHVIKALRLTNVYPPVNTAASCRAFTLIEVMVVLTILMALMGMGFGSYKYLRENANKDATKALVESLASAMAVKGPTASGRTKIGDASSIAVKVVLWDANGDGFVDGRLTVMAAGDSSGPAAADPIWRSVATNGSGKGPAHAAGKWQLLAGNDDEFKTVLQTASYEGIASAATDIPENFMNERGQPIDSWGRPLRYGYAPTVREGAAARTDTKYIVNDGGGKLAKFVGAKGFAVWSDGPDATITTDDIWSNP